MTTKRPGQQRPTPTSRSFLEKAALVVTPGTVVIALMYYIGRVYTNAYFSVFGISASELDYAPEDYLVTSPEAFFDPLWFLLLGGLGSVLAFGLLDRWLSQPLRRGLRRPVYRWIAATGIALLVLSGSISNPYLAAVGSGLALFALYLRAGGHRRTGRSSHGRDWLRTVVAFVLIAMLIMSVFTSLAWYVDGHARDLAKKQLSSGSVLETRVVLHTHTAMFGRPDQTLGDAHRPYRFRYHRFCILARSSKRYYLIPCEPGRNEVTVVRRDDPTLKVDLRTG